MAGTYSHTTRAAGTVLTANIYNADHQNHVNNAIPASIDDYSTNTTEMRTTADPGEGGSESLAVDLSGEISRLRHLILELAGGDYWYESPNIPCNLIAMRMFV